MLLSLKYSTSSRELHLTSYLSGFSIPFCVPLSLTTYSLGPVFYAAAPGSYFTKLEYAASGLAPAVLLTVLLAVALALVAQNDVLASVVAWALLLNVMGSAGDMLMMSKLVPYPRATSFEDTGEGFVAFGPVSGFESQ